MICGRGLSGYVLVVCLYMFMICGSGLFGYVYDM